MDWLRLVDFGLRNGYVVDGYCCAGGSFRGPFVSSHNEWLAQNWHGQGESDCLIKTKHCDGFC